MLSYQLLVQCDTKSIFYVVCSSSQHGGSTSSLNGGFTSSYSRSPGRRPTSLASSGYESGYTSPGYVSPSPTGYLSPTFRYATSPIPWGGGGGEGGGGGGGGLGGTSKPVYDVKNPTSPPASTLNGEHNAEYERSLEYHQAPDTFPCGHVLCHHCLRKFIQTLGGSCGARCPVCRMGVTEDDVSLASMGLPSGGGCGGGGEGREKSASTSSRSSRSCREDLDPPISLLSNFDEIVLKFNGLQQNLRRLKDESVQSRSMGMTYTNTVCHLCRQAHPTLRVIQVRHNKECVWGGGD
jgi:hypothetical protein